jgi:NADP-dependent 3-hydroxy acid dehydrogenase YdfG
MEKKIILVTGATSGIGEATARRLAASKHAVVLAGRNREKLEEMRRDLASAGQRVAVIAGDLTKEEDARFVVTEALKAFGAVQVLVHSAGVFRMNRAENTTAEEFREVLDTNVTSLQSLLKHLLPHFYKEGFGHVVAISSIAGRIAFPGETAYCSSKWGLMGYLGALQMEAGQKGVRVSAIMPGPTLTPSWETYQGKLIHENMLSAETVAEAVSFVIDQPENVCIQEMLIMPAKNPFGDRMKVT